MMSYVKGHLAYLMLRHSQVMLEDIKVVLKLDRAVELAATGQLFAQLQ